MMVNECSWTKVGTILLTVIYEKMKRQNDLSSFR